MCRCRTVRVDFTRLVSLSLCVAAMLGLSLYARALRNRPNGIPRAVDRPLAAILAGTGEVLTNDDFCRMGRAQIPTSVMERLIYGQPHNFRIDADSLIALKKDGVSDDVILAMVTTTLEHGSTPVAPNAPEAILRARRPAREDRVTP
jgi:hypothetical protein